MDKTVRDKFMHSNGTTATESYSVILPTYFLSFLATTLCTVCLSSVSTEKQCSIKQFVIEFVIVVIPVVLNLTVLASHANEVIVALFVVTFSLCFVVLRNKSDEKPKPKIATDNSKQSFITNGRSTINLLSIIAILAVDFKVFPRRFAKTETYGYSLMDVGVGLYVFGNGVVAPEIRNFKDSFSKNFKGALPLFVIGGARFLITKQVDYHVPVSEYGLHWNFFITLAMVRITSSLILKIIPIRFAMFSGAFILFVHETFLQLGLATFVFSNVERNSFLNANREGIASLLGYVGLYFLSVAFGMFTSKKSEHYTKSKWKMFCKLSTCAAVLFWATRVLEKNFGISRRLANSGYCVWIMFIGVSVMAQYFLSENVQKHIFKMKKITNPVYVPVIFQAINYNGLVFFLLANILTGYVNLVFDTMNTSDFIALVILGVYSLINCFVVFTLYHKGIRLKL